MNAILDCPRFVYWIHKFTSGCHFASSFSVREKGLLKSILWSESCPAAPKISKILGVDKSASESDIKKAYRTLEGGDPEKFKEINRAYVVLRDPSERKAHFFDRQKIQNGTSQRAKEKRQPGQKSIPGGESEERCSEGGMARCTIHSQH